MERLRLSVSWSDVGRYVSHFEVGLSLILGIPTLALAILVAYRKLRARLRTTATVDPDHQQRRSRRGHRRPLTQPSRVRGVDMPEKLAKSMGCVGRVPIEHYRHQRRLIAFWRVARLNLLPRRTRAKSAFTATDWRFEPISSTPLAATHPYSGGFVLKLRVHQNENRWHLRRSLMAARSRISRRRLVVIASARDMCEPTSWVRCLVVNAETLRLPKRRRGWIVVRGADPALVDGRIVYRCRQHTVPADAVWLIVPAFSYHEPSSTWGQSPERHDQQQAVPAGYAPEDCGGVDNERYVRKAAAMYRMGTALLWVVLGPVVVGAAWLMSLPGTSHAADEALAEWESRFYALYITTYLYAVIAVLLYVAYDAMRALVWRCREKQTYRDWKGGTDECLIMGGLLRRGPALGQRAWKEYCTDTVPAD